MILSVLLIVPLAGCVTEESNPNAQFPGFITTFQVDANPNPLKVQLGSGSYLNDQGHVEAAGMLNMSWKQDFAYAALDTEGNARWLYLPCEWTCDRSAVIWTNVSAPFGINIKQVDDQWIRAPSNPPATPVGIEQLWQNKWTEPRPSYDDSPIPSAIHYSGARLTRTALDATDQPAPQLAAKQTPWPELDATRPAKYLYNGENDPLWNGEGSVRGAVDFVRRQNPTVDAWLAGDGCVQMAFYTNLLSDPQGGPLDAIHDSRTENIWLWFADGKQSGLEVKLNFNDNTLGGGGRDYHYLEENSRLPTPCYGQTPSAPIGPLIRFAKGVHSEGITVNGFVVIQEDGFTRYTTMARPDFDGVGGYVPFAISWDATHQKMRSASLAADDMRTFLGL